MIELLITIAIFLALAAVAGPLANRFSESASLGSETDKLAQTISVARERSVARWHQSAHGVYFEPSVLPGESRYTLYQGANYANRDQNYDVAFDLPVTITLGVGGSARDFNFAAGTGELGGRTVLTLTDNAGGVGRVFLNQVGAALIE